MRRYEVPSWRRTFLRILENLIHLQSGEPNSFAIKDTKMNDH